MDNFRRVCLLTIMAFFVFWLRFNGLAADNWQPL